jgi:hypothetical protein
MPNKDLLEINRRVLLKCYREQDKDLFAGALWRYVNSVAREFQYGDGFVEWPMVKAEVDETMAEIVPNGEDNDG